MPGTDARFVVAPQARHDQEGQRMAARKVGNKAAQPIDAHVGTRIRFRRNLLAISQTDMAERIGVTFQQVQKYERGTNRIGASRLIKICEVLEVSPEWLFEGAPGTTPKAPAEKPPSRGVEAALASFRMDNLAPRLLMAWTRLPADTKRSMVALMTALADGGTINGMQRRGRRRHVSMVAVTGT